MRVVQVCGQVPVQQVVQEAGSLAVCDPAAGQLRAAVPGQYIR